MCTKFSDEDEQILQTDKISARYTEEEKESKSKLEFPKAATTDPQPYTTIYINIEQAAGDFIRESFGHQ